MRSSSGQPCMVFAAQGHIQVPRVCHSGSLRQRPGSVLQKAKTHSSETELGEMPGCSEAVTFLPLASLSMKYLRLHGKTRNPHSKPAPQNPRKELPPKWWEDDFRAGFRRQLPYTMKHKEVT